VTEDDKPVDNRFSERQQRLLPHLLFTSWPEGKPFEALSDVGLFYALDEPAVAPDFMLSAGVTPRPVSSDKKDRSYLVWVYGKPPDLCIEVVSNKKGEELGEKMALYAHIRVTYYVVYDPFLMLGDRKLRAFCLSGGRYTEMLVTDPFYLEELGLGMTLWEGTIEDVYDTWLRFTDSQGRLLLTGEELARQAEAKVEQAEVKVEQAEAKVEQAEAKVEQAEARARQAEARALADRLQIARRLLAQGLDRTAVAQITELSVDQLPSADLE
jgi:Uma2 family endonuclease